MDTQEILPVTVAALVEDPTSKSPIVVLHHLASDRVLLIWIGDPEARAIALALNRVDLERPLTHNLLSHVIAHMGGKLVDVVITKLEKNTYFANLRIKVGEKLLAVDARTSDAIALALTTGVPIHVSKKLMDAASQPNPISALQPKPHERKMEFTEGDLSKLRGLLEKAREREQHKSEE